MFELRWKVMMHTAVWRVLQYRQVKLRVDSSGSLTPLPPPVEWTEWKDVPYIGEEKP